jgi:hypothetical protein
MTNASDHVEHPADLDVLAYVERHCRPFEGDECVDSPCLAPSLRTRTLAVEFPTRNA